MIIGIGILILWSGALVLNILAIISAHKDGDTKLRNAYISGAFPIVGCILYSIDLLIR